MEKQVGFKSRGFVLGNYWGGGQGAYSAANLNGDSKEELLMRAETALHDGSLDSGMGYESLIGAILEITKITRINIEGKEFVNEESEDVFIGDLNDGQRNFLLTCFLHG